MNQREFQKALGLRIAKGRGELSQGELVKRLGWGKAISRLSNYENGTRMPPMAAIAELAREFKVSPCVLLFGEASAPIVDKIEMQLLHFYRNIRPGFQDKLIAEANWLFNQEYPGQRTSANPFPDLPLPPRLHEPAGGDYGNQE